MTFDRAVELLNSEIQTSDTLESRDAAVLKLDQLLAGLLAPDEIFNPYTDR